MACTATSSTTTTNRSSAILLSPRQSLSRSSSSSSNRRSSLGTPPICLPSPRKPPSINLYQQRQKQLLQATQQQAMSHLQDPQQQHAHQQQQVDPSLFSNQQLDVEFLEIQLTVIQGDGLAAKDRNLLGQRTTSDPYVRVALLPQGPNGAQELSLGLTSTILKTLCPVWKEEFTVSLPVLQLTDDAILRLTILDYDVTTADDCMGIVDIHVPLQGSPKTNQNENDNAFTKWYAVPATSAPNASGRIQCMLKTKRQLLSSLQTLHRDPDTTTPQEDDTESTTMNNNTTARSTRHTEDSMTFAVTIVAGAGLAAKDRNLVGKRTSSDPYVKAVLLTTPPGSHGRVGDPHYQEQQELFLGKTKTIPHSLSPTWNERFEITFKGNDLIRVNQAQLQLSVYDHDKVTADDCMGVVTIPVPLVNTPKRAQWYGIPPHSARHASGRLQVALETTINYASNQFRRQPQPQPQRERERGGNSTSTSDRKKTTDSKLGSSHHQKIRERTLVRGTSSRFRSSSGQSTTTKARSRDSSAFCTPRRVGQRTVKAVPGMAAATTPLSLHDSPQLGEQEDVSKSPSGTKTPGTSRSTTPSRSRMFTRHHTKAQSKDSSAFCTPKRTTSKMLKSKGGMADKIKDLALDEKETRQQPKQQKEGEKQKQPIEKSSSSSSSSSSSDSRSNRLVRPRDSPSSVAASPSVYCTPKRTTPKMMVKSQRTPNFMGISLSPNQAPPNQVDKDQPCTGAMDKKTKEEPTEDAVRTPTVQNTLEKKDAETPLVALPIFRPPKTTWKCCCGYESVNSRQFCGMCGTKQHWACASCSFDKNLCLFRFCGMCGIAKGGISNSSYTNSDCRSNEKVPVVAF